MLSRGIQFQELTTQPCRDWEKLSTGNSEYVFGLRNKTFIKFCGVSYKNSYVDLLCVRCNLFAYNANEDRRCNSVPQQVKRWGYLVDVFRSQVFCNEALKYLIVTNVPEGAWKPVFERVKGRNAKMPALEDLVWKRYEEV